MYLIAYTIMEIILRNCIAVFCVSLLTVIVIQSYVIYLQFGYIMKVKNLIESYTKVLSANSDSITYLGLDIQKSERFIRILQRKIRIRDRIIVSKNLQLKNLTEGKGNAN